MERMEKKEKKSELEIELEQTIDFLRKRMSEYEFEYNKQLRDIKFLEEENKKLKEQLERMKTDTMYDMKDINSLYEENKKLKEKVRFLEECLDRKEKLNEKYRKEIEELKETLEHRDSILSIMYDLLRSDLGDYEQLCMIDVVIDVEVGNEPQNKLREELLDRFWKRDF